MRKIKNYTFWDLFKHTKISKINHRKAPSKSKHRYRYIPYFVLQPYESKLDTTSRGSSGSETLLRISGRNIRPYLTSGGANIRRCMIIQRIWHLRYGTSTGTGTWQNEFKKRFTDFRYPEKPDILEFRLTANPVISGPIAVIWWRRGKAFKLRLLSGRNFSLSKLQIYLRIISYSNLGIR